jgi:hypothetical protein
MKPKRERPRLRTGGGDGTDGAVSTLRIPHEPVHVNVATAYEYDPQPDADYPIAYVDSLAAVFAADYYELRIAAQRRREAVMP